MKDAKMKDAKMKDVKIATNYKTRQREIYQKQCRAEENLAGLELTIGQLKAVISDYKAEICSLIEQEKQEYILKMAVIPIPIPIPTTPKSKVVKCKKLLSELSPSELSDLVALYEYTPPSDPKECGVQK